MTKKHLINLISSLIGAFMLVGLYLFSPAPFQSMDHNLRDLFFQIRGEIPTTNQVVIIDIDEKSLATIGQWPWERNIVARLLDTLAEDGAGIIGLDIVFPEADKTSPAYLTKKLGLPLVNPPDYDAILAKTLAQTPTVLGYVFNMSESTPGALAPVFPGIVIEKNRPETPYFFEPKGVLSNLAILQENAYSSGFFNNLPDNTGMIRSVPLVMQYQDKVYPSLALEMLRLARGDQPLRIVHAETGIESIRVDNQVIPTNRYGQLFVNYRGGGHTFPYISAADVLKGTYNKKDIKNKWVLVGTSAAGLLDLRAMPLDTAYPGVEAHATVIDNILKGDLLSRPFWTDAADLVLILLIFTISYLSFKRLKAAWIPLATIAGFLMLYQLMDYLLFTQGIILTILFPVLAFFLALILAVLSNYFFEAKQKTFLKQKLSSKVSPLVMNEILKNESQNIMQGQSREITVFFSDLRNFTRISEAMADPKTLITFLNEYTTPMTEIIVAHQGTVDKFIGDAIMAYWNAPVTVDNHADLAVTASLAQLQAIKKLNQQLSTDSRFETARALCKAHHIELLDIGIGLNSGDAIVGEMGSAGRSDYTVIGDTVNLGSRLESLCKFYGSSINISHFTKAKLQNDYVLQYLDLVTVKGKEHPVEIWQVHDFGVAEGTLKNELDRYHQAIAYYKNSDFESALARFNELSLQIDNINPKLYALYIERCQHYIKFRPKDFNGVFEHASKH